MFTNEQIRLSMSTALNKLFNIILCKVLFSETKVSLIVERSYGRMKLNRCSVVQKADAVAERPEIGLSLSGYQPTFRHRLYLGWKANDPTKNDYNHKLLLVLNGTVVFIS